jgi:hypothetical protein
MPLTIPCPCFIGLCYPVGCIWRLAHYQDLNNGTGATVSDSSGNGPAATLVNAAWTGGSSSAVASSGGSGVPPYDLDDATAAD